MADNYSGRSCRFRRVEAPAPISLFMFSSDTKRFVEVPVYRYGRRGPREMPASAHVNIDGGTGYQYATVPDDLASEL